MLTKKFPVLLGIGVLLLNTMLFGQPSDYDNNEWQSVQIEPGLTWKSFQSTLDEDSLSINLLEVDLSLRNIDLIYDPEENHTTSAFATKNDALAAVNAGFFDMKNGGSVSYILINGEIINEDTTGWGRAKLLNGAILKDKHGQVYIDEVKTNYWYDTTDYWEDILVTGPLLLENGGTTMYSQVTFNLKRHPRTAVCIDGDNQTLWLATIDGRHPQSAGMTIPELSMLMHSLGCQDAVNLDGGGSTTMWIEGEGVVNYPSDNQKFDHEGERPVSNVLIIK